MLTHENHAVIIYSPEFAREKLYSLHNPGSGVRKPEDYIYSSATNYTEMDSILDV
jgi:putative transposase